MSERRVPPGEPTERTLAQGRGGTGVLVLEDGRAFAGQRYGATGDVLGEAVFCTGMTGYQETLTDPSYHRQVVVMTSPHVGNTGWNAADCESDRIWVAGYVVRDPARSPSSWRSERSLESALVEHDVVGLHGVDTRALTRHLRERGVMRVGVSTVDTDTVIDIERLLAAVRASPAMTGADLAREVSTARSYVVPAVGRRRGTVAAIDLGIKSTTPRRLAARGIEVHVLPATTSPADLLAGRPDGVFFSNGPGDPGACDYAVAAMRAVLEARVPLFGICLGNQILGRALGLGTYKLAYGHRGLNQPVQDRRTGRVAITAHNHGFAVAASLDGEFDTDFGRAEVSHVGLNDGVVEGLRCLDVPAFGVQFHPEAAAGPHDSDGLFDSFVELMSR